MPVRTPSPHHPLMPALAAAAGIATFGMMDAAMKSASMQSGVYGALIWRNVIGAGLMLPLWLAMGGRWPGRSALAIHGLRALVVAPMLGLFFWGLVRTPLAVAIAISFISPLIALYLAAFTLGEPITRRAVTASLLGLGGVVVIGVGRFGGGHMLGADSLLGIAAILGSAVLYAGNLVLQRHQAQRASPTEIAFFQSAIVALMLAPAAPWLAHLPTRMAWAEIAGSAVLSTASLMLLSWAYARAEAHKLLAVEYSGFIWAALMGWLFFNESLSAATLAGVVLIVIGCWIGTAGKATPDHTEQTVL